MYIPFKSRTYRQKGTKQPGLLVRSCKRCMNGGIFLADAARALLHKHPKNDADSQSRTRSTFPASATLPLVSLLYNGVHNLATIPLLPSVPGLTDVPVPVNLLRTIGVLDDRQRYVCIVRPNLSLRPPSAANDVDRTSREADEALDHIDFPSVEDLKDPHSMTCGISEAQLPGENTRSEPDTADSTKAQQGSECSLTEDRSGCMIDESSQAKLTLADLIALSRSQYRRVSEEPEKILVNTSAKTSRSPFTEEEEPLRLPSTRESLIDQEVTGSRENKAKCANYHAPKEVATLLEQAIVGVQNMQQENERLKAENDVLRAQNKELKSLKDTSEELNDAYEQRLIAETQEKAELEQWLTEETTEIVGLEKQLEVERTANFELLKKNCQQVKKAARDQERLKALGRHAFERMILLCQMLKRFGVDTQDNDHDEIGSQALEIVGAEEKMISAGFAAQARNALEEQQKSEAVELREQQEIEQMEDRMADSLADGNFITCRYDGTWVNMRTGDEIKKREEVRGNGDNMEDKGIDSVNEDEQDPRWMPGMKVYHRFWKDSSTISPTKEELDNVYK